MKIIKPSVEFFGTAPTDYAGTLAFIEMAGRLCYKSEDKITADSAEGFAKRLINAGHLAMVEHSNFVVWAYADDFDGPEGTIAEAGKYLNVTWDNDKIYVGGSLTAWSHQSDLGTLHTNAHWPFLYEYGGLFGFCVDFGGDYSGSWQVCPHNEIPEALHRYSAKFICDRGVSHELVRHRPCSFAQESTRYVNYGGKDMEFIEPWWWKKDDGGNLISTFIHACAHAQKYYEWMLDFKAAPQAARAVLPNALKTEIIVTADAAEWGHIKKLRTHPSAHPDMVRVMNMMPWEEMGL